MILADSLTTVAGDYGPVGAIALGVLGLVSTAVARFRSGQWRLPRVFSATSVQNAGGDTLTPGVIPAAWHFQELRNHFLDTSQPNRAEFMQTELAAGVFVAPAEDCVTDLSPPAPLTVLYADEGADDRE